MNNKQRIFLGPYEVAGYTCNLSKGFKQIGSNIRFIDLWDHPFNYGGNDNGRLENYLRKIKKAYHKNTKKQLSAKLIFGVLNVLLSLIHFIKALFSYDVYIFIFGYSLLPYNLDLPILKALGKRIIFNMALGSEARPPYMNGVYQSNDGSDFFSIETLARLTYRIKKKVSRIEHWSDIVIGSPFSTSQLMEKKFVNTFALGFPRFVSELRSTKNINGTCRILHSPSHPAAKGTNLIIESVEALKKKGYKIEFILLKNKTNNEVLSALANCDFIVDQVYSDTPLGGFACEAASLGKPAIIGGYTAEQFKKYIAPSMTAPSVYCHPDKLQEAIETLVIDPDLRIKVGAESHSFVRIHWSAVSVAKRYTYLLTNQIPEDFWVDPLNINYFHGSGQSEKKTKELVKSLVEMYGTSVLQLDHNTILRDNLLEFADLDRSDY